MHALTVRSTTLIFPCISTYSKRLGFPLYYMQHSVTGQYTLVNIFEQNKQGNRDLAREREREKEMDVTCCEKATSTVKEEEEEEDIETLKKRIKGHALFRLLVERHLDCLKVSLGDNEEVDIASPASCEAGTECNGHGSFLPSDLDKFMEVQCMALGKLKEAMEIPLQENLSFINAMYQQLN